MFWFKSHSFLGDEPALVDMATRLKIPLEQALGHVTFLFWRAPQHAPDGNLLRLNPTALARMANWTGKPLTFRVVMRKSGVLGADGRLFHWEECVGTLMAWRRANAERMKKARKMGRKEIRAVNVQRTSRERAGPGAVNVQNTCSERAGPEKSRVEKSRVEKKRELWGSGKVINKSKGVCYGEVAGGDTHTHTITDASEAAGKSETLPNGYPTWEQWHVAALAAGMPEDGIREEWANQERKKLSKRWEGMAIDPAGLQSHATFVMALRKRRENSRAPGAVSAEPRVTTRKI